MNRYFRHWNTFFKMYFSKSPHPIFHKNIIACFCPYRINKTETLWAICKHCDSREECFVRLFMVVDDLHVVPLWLFFTREWAAIICTAMMGSHKSKLCLLSLPGLMTALFVAGGGSLDKYMQTFCLQVLFEWQPAWQSRSIMNMWEKLWAKYSSLDFGRLKVGFAKSVCKPSSLQFWALAKLQLSLMED